MKLIFNAVVVLCLPFFSTASVTKINGYEPTSVMTDQTAMDLDQNAIMFHLLLSSESGFETAKSIYDNGSYTDSYAILQLSGGNVPAAGVSKGTKISGMTSGDKDITGEAYENMPAGGSTLKFKYPVYDMPPPNHSGCIVGSLPTAWQSTVGCLKESGTINIDGIGSVSYTYSLADDNKNGRSFKGWSKNAVSEMEVCPGCPYKEFSKYKNYYGQADYADEWITAALEGRATKFPNLGGADFSSYGYDGRLQAVMKGTAYITDPMYTLRQLEYALDQCKAKDQDSSVYAWDEGVAFYTGSWALGEPGILMYVLAEKRCKNFKTCGRDSNELEGTSYVNLEMFDIFNLGKFHLTRGECDPIRDLVDRAATLIRIPNIQGTLRYAYKVGTGTDTSEKAKGEGAAFAAAILPAVHACNEADAKIIYDHMKVAAPTTDFYAVLKAFENNYGCMGIAGWEVGAYYDSAANGGEGGFLYTPGVSTARANTAPGSSTTTTTDLTTQSSSGPNTLAIGLGVGLSCAVLLLIGGFMYTRKKGDKEIDGPDNIIGQEGPV